MWIFYYKLGPHRVTMSNEPVTCFWIWSYKFADLSEKREKLGCFEKQREPIAVNDRLSLLLL